MTNNLEKEYKNRFERFLISIAEQLEQHLIERIGELERIDRISARAKDVSRFLEKASRLDPDSGEQKYSDPLMQIQDQIGARVVTFYLSDVERVATEIRKYYAYIEERVIVSDSPREFDYEGMHYILMLPDDIIEPEWEEIVPEFFELQIKTLFQHAWGEANHDLGYKPIRELNHDEIKMIAFTAAQAWGADRIFDELHISMSKTKGPE